MSGTATSRLLAATPAWQADPPPEVVIRHRSGSVSSRRPYPVAKNDPFVPNRPFASGFSLVGTGEGNDIYLQPDSGENRNRIKRIRNIGGGSPLLVDQVEGDADNKLRSVRAKPGMLVSVEQLDETLDVGTTGISGFVDINIDGFIETVSGVVRSLVTGRRGGTGTFGYTRCGGSRTQLFSWENGQILDNGDITVDVGDCGTTSTPGP